MLSHQTLRVTFFVNLKVNINDIYFQLLLAFVLHALEFVWNAVLYPSHIFLLLHHVIESDVSIP